MDRHPSHQRGNILIKTIVREEHVSDRNSVHSSDKLHMAHMAQHAPHEISPVSDEDDYDADLYDDPDPNRAPVASNDQRDPRLAESSPVTHPVASFNAPPAVEEEVARTPTIPLPDRIAHLHSPLTTTVLDLLTESAAPSALPQPLGFHMSRKGRQIAVFNATHVHLIDAEVLPRAFVRSLEVKRRPVALDMLDDGTMLILLDSPTVLNVYSMNGGEGDAIAKKCGIDLQHDSKTVAISADGLVVAAGHRFGIEIVTLESNAKRIVSVDRMDFISFSDDSRMLLATTKATHNGATTTISVTSSSFDGPVDLDGFPAAIEPDKAWTTQILFPEKAKSCKHAVILPDLHSGQASALFSFDTQAATWGIYDIEAASFVHEQEFLPQLDDWSRTELVNAALPAVSPSTSHVAIAVKQDRYPELWVYKLPADSHDLAHTSDDANRADLGPCLRLPLPHDDAVESQEISILRWFRVPSNPDLERLVAVGGTVLKSDEHESMSQMTRNATSTGAIIVMDFDITGRTAPLIQTPQKIVFDLDSLLPGEKLPEEEVTFEREVELLRTRTVAQRRAATRAARRTSTTHSPPVTRSHTTRPRITESNSFLETPAVPPLPDDETLNPDEAAAAFEEPYSHAQPRSQASLNRAATVAAASNAGRRHLRALPNRPLEYRRADGSGMREIPHESDADNWVPPPPPYSETPGPTDARVVQSTPAQPLLVPPVAAPVPLPEPPHNPVPHPQRQQMLAPAPRTALTPSFRTVSSPAPMTNVVSAPAPPAMSPLTTSRRPLHTSPQDPVHHLPPPPTFLPSFHSNSSLPRLDSTQSPFAVAVTADTPRGAGLRRNSSTFPMPSMRSGVRLQPGDLNLPPQRPVHNTHRSAYFEQQRPASVLDTRRNISAYAESSQVPNGRTAYDPRRQWQQQQELHQQQLRHQQQLAQRPQPPIHKQEKKGTKCIIM